MRSPLFFFPFVFLLYMCRLNRYAPTGAETAAGPSEPKNGSGNSNQPAWKLANQNAALNRSARLQGDSGSSSAQGVASPPPAPAPTPVHVHTCSVLLRSHMFVVCACACLHLSLYLLRLLTVCVCVCVFFLFFLPSSFIPCSSLYHYNQCLPLRSRRVATAAAKRRATRTTRTVQIQIHTH